MGYEFTALPVLLLQHVDLAWTFLLLIVRFTAFLSLCPGLGQGATGVVIRLPAILVFSFAALVGGKIAAIPPNSLIAVGMVVSEIMFGSFIGFLPLLIIAGMQTALGMASTSMGLQASQLMNPTLQVSVSDVARIFGDLVVLIFISSGGAHAVLYAVAGLGGTVVPGSFVTTDAVVSLLLDNTAKVFEIGVLFSAPVVVALLLTNIMLGLVSKAVPTVNVFIISFPVTIGVGLVLSIYLVRELPSFLQEWFQNLEPLMRLLAEAGKATAP